MGRLVTRRGALGVKLGLRGLLGRGRAQPQAHEYPREPLPQLSWVPSPEGVGSFSASSATPDWNFFDMRFALAIVTMRMVESLS